MKSNATISMDSLDDIFMIKRCFRVGWLVVLDLTAL